MTLACIVSTSALPALAESVPTQDAAPAVSVEESTLPSVGTSVDSSDTASADDSAADALAAAINDADNSAADVPLAATTDADNSAADTPVADTTTDKQILASAENKTVDGNQTSTYSGTDGAVRAAEGGTLTVNGNVTCTNAEKGYGVFAQSEINGKLSSITVNGNVDSGKSLSAVVAYGRGTSSKLTDITEAKATVNGNVTSNSSESLGMGTVWGQERGMIEINGNVTNTSTDKFSTAVSSNIDSIVTVNGDVKAGKLGAYTLNGDVRINGNVETGESVAQIAGIHSKVIITGDVTGTGDQIIINGGTVPKNSQVSSLDIRNEIAVGGKIKNASGNAAKTTLLVDVHPDAYERNLPEFVFGEIENMKNVDVVDRNGTTLSPDIKQKILDRTKYVVRHANKSEDGQAAITVTKSDGSALEKDLSGTYEVAKKGEKIKVNVQSIPGWVAKILPGKDNTVQENTDGSYTVTVAEGGGIDIRAVLSKIVTPPVTPPIDPPVNPPVNPPVDPTPAPVVDGGENTIEPKVFVVDKNGERIPFTKELKDGGVMVFTSTEDISALTGNLLGLKELNAYEIRFVTPHKTTTALYSNVYSGGGDNDFFVMAHDNTDSYLVVNFADHTDYLY